jgi:hypothetical protein
MFQSIMHEFYMVQLSIYLLELFSTETNFTIYITGILYILNLFFSNQIIFLIGFLKWNST